MATIASSLLRISGQNRKGTLPVLSWTRSAHSTMLPAGLSTRPTGGPGFTKLIQLVSKELHIFWNRYAMFLGNGPGLVNRSDLSLRIRLPLEPRGLPANHSNLRPLANTRLGGVKQRL